MDLIERYLSAVGFLLPRDQREDITAELRDALMTRREEMEAEAGRPLTLEEDAALLRAFGHPLDVAARFGRQHYLVGPELYPLYAFAVKILLAIVAASAVITAVIAVAVNRGDPGFAIATALQTLWSGIVGSIGVLTIIAAVMQRQKIRPRFLYDWTPQDLPRQPKRPKLRRRTAFDHVAGVIAQIIFVLWWIHVIPIPLLYIPLKPGQSLGLEPASIWSVLFWPVLGLSALAIVVHALRLAGKSYERTADVADLVLHVVAVIVVGVALRAGDWIEISAAGLPPEAAAHIHFGVNTGIQVALIVSLVSSACQAACAGWRLYRGGRADGPTSPG